MGRFAANGGERSLARNNVTTHFGSHHGFPESFSVFFLDILLQLEYFFLSLPLPANSGNVYTG